MADLSPALQAAVLAALFQHECGSSDAIAHRLSFAEKDNSGASFGKLQNDCHANPAALAALQAILRQALVPEIAIGRILGLLRQACPRNPLSTLDTSLVDTALASSQGRAATDALDQRSLAGVLEQLGRYQDAAARNGGATIQDAALIALALWTNAAGPLTMGLRWLEGHAVVEHAGAPGLLAPGAPVTENNVVDYLSRTLEMTRAPHELQQLVEAVTIGLRALGSPADQSTSTPDDSAEDLNAEELRRVEQAAETS